jgi:hypothetical protein
VEKKLAGFERMFEGFSRGASMAVEYQHAGLGDLSSFL